MSQWKKWMIASAIVGLGAGAVCYIMLSTFGLGAADFKHALVEARDLLAGRDPFAHEPGPYWIPYPIPAAFLAMPLAWLPDPVVGAVFIGFSCALLAFAIHRSGETWRMAMLFSWPLFYATLFAQWSPLLCAMWFMPALAPLVLCKPNIALPFILTAKPRWKVGAAGAAIVAVSLLLKPDWPWVWLAQTRSYQGFTPPLFYLPLGPLILLSLFGWRERRAWLILTMAIIPQRMFYDQLALLLVANNKTEQRWLVGISWVSFAVLWLSPDMASMPGGWQLWVVLGHYLPATAVVTRQPLVEIARRFVLTPYNRTT